MVNFYNKNSNKTKLDENYGKSLFLAHKKALKLSHELGTLANKNRYTLYDKGLHIEDDVSLNFAFWDTLPQKRVTKRKIRFDQTANSYPYTEAECQKSQKCQNENKMTFNRYAILLNDLTKKEVQSLYKTISRRKLDKKIKSLK